MNHRPSLHSYMLMIARLTAERSTCSKHFKVGAVATQAGRIVMTGYNGVPSGMTHCDDDKCVRLADGKHAYLVHAEENVVAQAAKLGISLAGATLYITHCPCTHCLALLAQAGVSKVFFEVMPMNHKEDSKFLERICDQTGIVVMWMIPDEVSIKEIVDD